MDFLSLFLINLIMPANLQKPEKRFDDITKMCCMIFKVTFLSHITLAT